MKLIYIANARIPTEKAHGLQITKMCEALAQQGVEVELILPKRRKKSAEDLFQYYNIEKVFKVTYIPCIDFLGIRFFKRVSFFVQYLSFALSLFFYALCHRGKFKKADALYFRDELSPHFLRLVNKNVFLELHAFSERFKKQKNFFIKKIKGLILITRSAHKEFSTLGIPVEKILVAPDGVDLQDFDLPATQEEARKKLNLPQEKKIVIYTGHLYDWKGVDILLDAALYLPDNYLVVVVGGTESDIKRILTSPLNDSKIKILGHQKHSLMPWFLKAADVLVLPNKKGNELSEKFTSPLKLFEYMASGRPIVASDLPSIREVLNETNAVLVQPNQPQDLAQGIKRVISDKDLADQLAVQAFVDVKEYTWENRARNILSFIKERK